MKKVHLLSGMIIFGVATNIDAITMPKTKKGQTSLESVQQRKLIDQKIEALENRKPVYKMLDTLIVEDTAQLINFFSDGPIIVYPLKDYIDWAAVFHVLDSMKGVISVNEYLTPMTVKSHFYYDSSDLYEYEHQRPAEYLLLSIAVQQNNLPAAKTLLEKYKANPNKGDYSPFKRVFDQGTQQMFELLKEYGGKI